MFNKIVMLGNVTRDCDLRYLPSGGAVCTTGLATNRRFKKQDGTQGEEVCFIDITFFGRTAEIANQYLGRGNKVLVEGRLKLDQWTDQQGVKRSKHSITVETLQMINTKGEGVGQEEHAREASDLEPPLEDMTASDKRAHAQKPVLDMHINDDEIPF